MEWKNGTQKQLYSLAGNSSFIALFGKLLPQTILFSLMFVFCDVWFYKIMRYPCQAGIWHIILTGVVTVLASQAFGVFLFGLFIGKMRLAMCLCSLWGILSFSLAGFTYPVMAMSLFLRWFSYLFPSTFGMNGYVRITSMGASLGDIRTDYMALWIQAGVYFILACWFYRRQITSLARKYRRADVVTYKMTSGRSDISLRNTEKYVDCAD